MRDPKKECRQRKHSWDPYPPGRGSVCKHCGKIYGSYAKFVGAPPVDGDVAPGDRVSAFAAALGVSPAPAPAAAAPPASEGAAGAAAEEAPPPPSSKLWPHASKRIVQVFVAIVEATIRDRGREPNAPDDADVREMETALAEQLGIWFPDVKLSPFKQLVLSGAFIAGSMWYGAEPIKDPKGKKPGAALALVPDAGTSQPTTSPPS
jgi:hypothetical protein